MSARPIGSEFEIRATPDWLGVYRVNSDELMWCLRWREIIKIAAWKEDLFSVDIICIGFSWAGSDVMKCADEEMAGWSELDSALADRYRIDHSAWWNKIVRPAFAENFMIIWSRNDPEAQSR